MIRSAICRVWLPTVVLQALLACLSGCKKDEPIRHYTVPKPEAIDRLAGSDTAPAEPSRMLAAAVLRSRQAWFFKLVGADEAVAAQHEAFNKFIKSLRFGDDESPPDWTLPEGWTPRPGGAMRYATLAIDSDPPLEVSVTTLGREEGDDAAYLLANVNRWRGQVGLADLAADQLDRETEQLEIGGGEATVVDLVGRMKPGGPMSGGAPFAPLASGRSGRSDGPSPLDHANAPQPPASGASGPLRYDVPEGWTEEPVRGIRKASFRVSEQGESAEITVIDLDAAAGALLPNVNRWRGQVELGPTTQDQLDSDAQPIDVGGQKGTYIEMVGPKKTTLAVVVEAAGRAWFVTLKGDNALAHREMENFKAFVQSLNIVGAK